MERHLKSSVYMIILNQLMRHVSCSKQNSNVWQTFLICETSFWTRAKSWKTITKFENIAKMLEVTKTFYQILIVPLAPPSGQWGSCCPASPSYPLPARPRSRQRHPTHRATTPPATTPPATAPAATAPAARWRRPPRARDAPRHPLPTSLRSQIPLESWPQIPLAGAPKIPSPHRPQATHLPCYPCA